MREVFRVWGSMDWDFWKGDIDMKKISVSFIVVSLSIVLIISGAFIASASQDNSANRFNTCLVLDSTDSMRSSTDKERLRFEATKLFLGLLPNEGSKVGSVIFSDGIIKENPLTYINSFEDREKAEKDLETSEQLGDTTIGTALNRAVDMIQEQGDPNLKSYIILLTDGQSDKDKEARDEAVAKAKENNIPVYTIALNSGGDDEEPADVELLEQIAKATDGKFQEVTTPVNLTHTLEEFFAFVQGGKAIEFPDDEIPSDGRIKYTFDVPNQGIEGVNIIIHSEKPLKNMTLTRPDGETLKGSDIDKLTYTGKTFSIVKINLPEGGTWTLEGEGDPGAKINAKMIYNDTISVDVEYDKKDMYPLNEEIVIRGLMLDNGKVMKNGLQDYTAKLVSEEGSEEIPMEIGDDCFEKTLKFDTEGTYKYRFVLTGSGIDKSTEPFTLNVGNYPPEIDDSFQKEYQFTVWPFFTKTTEIDLTGAATDPDGDMIKYEVSSATYKDESYKMDGNRFVLTNLYDMSKGIVTIKAVDSHNTSSEFDLSIKLVNIGIITLIVIGAIAIVVLAAIGVLTYIWLNKRFMGDCYVSSFNYETGEYSEEVMRTKGRGRIKLSAFGVRAEGIDVSKCYLQATGKNYIYFVSKKPVFGGGTKGKRIKVTGAETQITATSGASSGLIVRFNSRLDNSSNGGW